MRFALPTILFFLLLSSAPQAADDPAQSSFDSAAALAASGQYDKAYTEFSRLRLKYPDSELAQRAQFEMGLCSLYAERFQDAAFDFQRLIDQYPNAELAKNALDFNSILYRLYLAPLSDKIAYQRDSSYANNIPDLDEPSGIAIDSKQNIYMSDKGKKAVYLFNASGGLVKTLGVLSPYSVFVDKEGGVIVANNLNALSIGNDPLTFSARGKTGPLEEIRSVALDPSGNYYVVSNKTPGILVYDHNKAPISTIGLATADQQYSKTLVSSRNIIYALDKDRKALMVFDSTGKTIFTITPAGKDLDFERIEDFAVDRTNHVYLLTKNPRDILIFSPSGKLLRHIPSVKKGAISFEDGRLITVGSSGAIYVVDKDTKQILKIG